MGPHDSFAFNLKTIATLVLTCLCALLANAAGIGGGPIYLPLLMVCKLKHEHVNLILVCQLNNHLLLSTSTGNPVLSFVLSLQRCMP